jgi:hypothetical protein
VNAIIEGRKGPLIDGAPFYQPDFQAALEAYHLRAVDAHLRHTRIDMEMPVLFMTVDSSHDHQFAHLAVGDGSTQVSPAAVAGDQAV